MRLGFLIQALESAIPYHNIRFQHIGHNLMKVDDNLPDYLKGYIDSIGIGDFHSYRGYYDHLGLSPSDKPSKVSEILKKAKQAMNSYFQGYKGGYYKMTGDTPVWCSQYGSASNMYIGDFKYLPNEVIIQIKQEEHEFKYPDDIEIDEILSGIGFDILVKIDTFRIVYLNKSIQYSIDDGNTWTEFEVDNTHCICNYFDRAMFTEDEMYIRDWNAEYFCEDYLKIPEKHQEVIIKPIGK